MRAPPESLSPTTGAPTFIARSMSLQIFAAFVSESDPPKTVKSCAKTKTGRPSTRTEPATTPSPGISFACVVHPEVAAAVDDEGVDLVEGAGVAEELDALARRELAGLVLLLAALRAASQPRLLPEGLEGESRFDGPGHGSSQNGIFFFSASIFFAFRNISA